MADKNRNLLRLKRALCLLLLGCAYYTTRESERPADDARQLSERFHFTRLAFPEPTGALARVRSVHPQLNHISSWISAVGAAAALNDLDGDGVPNDVCHVDPRSNTVRVLPVPGTGERYTPIVLDPAPLPYDPSSSAPMGCLPVDLNEDGQMDLLVYYWGRTPVMFLRSGAAYLPRELTSSGERWFSNAATSADMDGDGHVDLLVANYFPDGARILDTKATDTAHMQSSMTRAFNGGQKHFFLFRNGSTGPTPAPVFEEVSPQLEPEVMSGWTLAVGAADLDGDLLPELYLANDFGPDRLLHNRSQPGQLHFGLLEGKPSAATPASFVLGRDSFKGMGVDFGDLNGDGILDIYVSNIANEFALMEHHFCFLSTGSVAEMKQGVAPYVNSSQQLGLARSGWGWDAKLVDLNNDGILEALQAVGFLKGSQNRWAELQELATGNDVLLPLPQFWPRFQPGDELSGHLRNPIFVRGRAGKFFDIAPQLQLDEPRVTRGIAIADVDGDGDQDFVYASQWEPSVFIRNDCKECGAFLGLHLRLPVQGAQWPTRVQLGHPAPGVLGRPAIGATARVLLADGRQLLAQVDGGNGHSGKRSHDLHFGLGTPGARAVPVEIEWRNERGAPQRARFVLAPGWYDVQLGSSQAQEVNQ